MKREVLNKARLIENEIFQVESNLHDVNRVLESYNDFASEITIRHNPTTWSRSFGSKKFDFKKELKPVFEKMKVSLENELKELNEKLDKL